MSKLFLCGEGTSDFGTSEAQHFGALGEIVLRRLTERTGDETWRQRTSRFTHRDVPAEPTRRTNRTRRDGLSMEVPPPGDLCHLGDTCTHFVLFCLKKSALGVFHSDVDFTNSRNGARRREQVRNCLTMAIRRANGENSCIPVIPMPRTEAWLLRLAPECMMSAKCIEELPGNDRASRSPKSLLRQWHYSTGNHDEAKSLIRLVDEQYNADRLLKLSSFREFDTALEGLLRRIK